MKRYFYFVARLVKKGVKGVAKGMFETTEGYFDFVDAADMVARQNGVDIKDVVITFWTETNSVMYGKFRRVTDGD